MSMLVSKCLTTLYLSNSEDVWMQWRWGMIPFANEEKYFSLSWRHGNQEGYWDSRVLLSISKSGRVKQFVSLGTEGYAENY